MTAQTDRALQLSLTGHRAPVDYDRPPTHAEMIAEKDLLVPMRDGVKIAVDVYRPQTTDKLPALLAFSIHNKDLQGPDLAQATLTHPAWSMLWTGPAEAGDTRFFVSRGYVHVIGNPRGIGKSEGGGSRAGTGVGGASNVEYIPYHICSSKTVLHKIYHDPAHPSHTCCCR
jgi:uncharacterized protein